MLFPNSTDDLQVSANTIQHLDRSMLTKFAKSILNCSGVKILRHQSSSCKNEGDKYPPTVRRVE